jgi:beta-N-acetylhexosaminidase
MVDQECGAVSPLSRVTTFPPGHMALAAIGLESDAYWAARITGEKSKALGFDVVLAPVLDVNVEPANPIIGTRAFSDDPVIVSRFGIAVMRGLIDGGVMPVGKHFPGHGAAIADSHEELPRLTTSRQEFESRDLYPFRQAVLSGIPSIMVGHLFVPAIDPAEGPSSVSAALIDGVLRKKLSFSGLIVSDAMEMRGVADYCDTGEAAIAAVRAGMDLLIYVDVANALVAHQALLDAVKSGTVLESRVTEAYEKVVLTKASYMGLQSRPGGPEAIQLLDQEFEDKIAELNSRSMLTARGSDRVALANQPLLDSTVQALFVLTASTRRELERRREFLRRFEPLAKARMQHARFAMGEDVIQNLGSFGKELEEGTQLVLVSFSRTPHDEPLFEVIRWAESQSCSLILVAADNPWIVEEVPTEIDVVFCFGLEVSTLTALADRLLMAPETQALFPVHIQNREMPR